MDPMVCIVIIAVTFITSIYYFVTHKIVDGECLEMTRQTSGGGHIGAYYCYYKYQLKDDVYVGGGVSFFKHKVGKRYKIFVNPKKLDKVSPFSSIIEFLVIGTITVIYLIFVRIIEQM